MVVIVVNEKLIGLVLWHGQIPKGQEDGVGEEEVRESGGGMGGVKIKGPGKGMDWSISVLRKIGDRFVTPWTQPNDRPYNTQGQPPRRKQEKNQAGDSYQARTPRYNRNKKPQKCTYHLGGGRLLGLGLPPPPSDPAAGPPLPPLSPPLPDAAATEPPPLGLVDFVTGAGGPAFVLNGSFALGVPTALNGGCLRSLGFAAHADRGCGVGCLRGVVVVLVGCGLRGVVLATGCRCCCCCCCVEFVSDLDVLAVPVVPLLSALPFLRAGVVGSLRFFGAPGLETALVVVPDLFVFCVQAFEIGKARRKIERRNHGDGRVVQTSEIRLL